MTRRPPAQPAQTTQPAPLLSVPPIPVEALRALSEMGEPEAAWLWQVGWHWTHALGVSEFSDDDMDRWLESWPQWRSAPALVGLSDARAVRARSVGRPARRRRKGRR